MSQIPQNMISTVHIDNMLPEYREMRIVRMWGKNEVSKIISNIYWPITVSRDSHDTCNKSQRVCEGDTETDFTMQISDYPLQLVFSDCTHDGLNMLVWMIHKVIIMSVKPRKTGL